MKHRLSKVKPGFLASVEWELDGTQKTLVVSGKLYNHGKLQSSGQNLEEIAKLFPDDPQVQVIVSVWRKYHLNDMQAGCVHQRLLGWEKMPIDPRKPSSSYGLHFEGQRQPSWNLLGWVDASEHPQGLLSKPCPICGYKYGTAWKKKDIPEEIIQEIESWKTWI